MKKFRTYGAALLLLLAASVISAQESKPAAKPPVKAPAKAAAPAAGKAGAATSAPGRSGAPAAASAPGRGPAPAATGRGPATAGASGGAAGRGPAPGAGGHTGATPAGGGARPGTSAATRSGGPAGHGGPAPRGATTMHAGNGGEVNRRANGSPREVRTPNGAVVHHGLAGNRRVEMERPDHSRVVAERGGHGYVQHPYMYGGHEYAHRTYYEHGVAYDRFYGRYEYRPGIFVEVYSPVRFYAVGYYGWVYNPWVAPVAYAWGWNAVANPWYGYYGAYFTPAPVYPTASLWLTDYLISQSLANAYQAQVDAAVQMQAANAAASAAVINAEVKAQIAAEVQLQIARENAEAQLNARHADLDPGTSSIGRLLTDQKPHVFVVGRDLDLVDQTGQECAVSQGDVLLFNPAVPPDNDAAHLAVLASKGGSECRKGLQVAVAFPDLQDMQNHMREMIDKGMGDLQTRQGQGGLPPAPMAAKAAPVQASFAAAAPPPDPNAAAQINQQAQDAEKAEQETLSQVSAQGPSDAAAPAPPANPAAPPPTLTLGLTLDEVSGLVGADKLSLVADLGTKKIYTYNGLKITFTAGKITNIE